MSGATTMLWQKIDGPGHDACRLDPIGDGWRIQGAAAFRVDGGVPAGLVYTLECGPDWRSRRGRVSGFVGAEAVDLEMRRVERGWTLNGELVRGLEGCADLDYGFTPATNYPQLRRLDLAVGAKGEAPAAWLDVEARALSRLDQTYERRAADAYWYEAARFDYRALLELADTGFVRSYPTLWEAER